MFHSQKGLHLVNRAMVHLQLRVMQMRSALGFLPHVHDPGWVEIVR